MRIAFRVDSSEIIGSGHLLRSISLAKEFKKNNIESIFFSKKLSGNLNKLITDSKFKLRIVDTSINEYKVEQHDHLTWLAGSEEEDSDFCIKEFKKNNIDMVVVDHYGITEYWEKKLSKNNIKIFVIDDFTSRKHYCNYFLNQNLGDFKIKGLLKKKTKKFIGPKYALLSDKFHLQRSLQKKKFDKLRILINFGGVDKENLTYELINCLQGSQYIDDANICIVLGPGYRHEKAIIDLMNNSNFQFTVKKNPKQFSKLISESNLFIGGCGSTSWERCCLSTPSLVVSQSPNQDNIYKELIKNNIAIGIDHPFNVNDIDKKIQEIIKSDYELLKIMSQKSSKQCDGLGCSRIVKFIMDDSNEKS